MQPQQRPHDAKPERPLLLPPHEPHPRVLPARRRPGQKRHDPRVAEDAPPPTPTAAVEPAGELLRAVLERDGEGVGAEEAEGARLRGGHALAHVRGNVDRAGEEEGEEEGAVARGEGAPREAEDGVG